MLAAFFSLDGDAGREEGRDEGREEGREDTFVDVVVKTEGSGDDGRLLRRA